MAMKLEDMFNEIFRDIRKALEGNDDGAVPDSTATEPELKNKSIPVSFHLDANGNYHFEAEKYGAGMKVQFCVRISDPDARYSVSIRSSAGGGGNWQNVHPKEPICGELHTSLLKKTKLSMDIHANVKDKDGHAVVDVTYPALAESPKDKAESRRTRFMLAEYGSLRKEIATYVQDTRNLEKYAVGGTAAVWAWLVVHRSDISGWMTLGWFIPLLFPIFDGWRSLTLYHHVREIGKYIQTKVEKDFTGEGRFEEYLRGQPSAPANGSGAPTQGSEKSHVQMGAVALSSKNILGRINFHNILCGSRRSFFMCSRSERTEIRNNDQTGTWCQHKD